MITLQVTGPTWTACCKSRKKSFPHEAERRRARPLRKHHRQHAEKFLQITHGLPEAVFFSRQSFSETVSASRKLPCKAGSRAEPPTRILKSPFSATDRKSTRLNSSHRCISYAVFCLKK